MGIIHVAEWRGVKVAIKEASAQVISKEVEIYNRMKGYEGVVQFYGVTYPPGLNKLCIVTKYAENGSLSWYLKAAFHKLTWAHKLQLASQIASGIARLHQEGIYHRDLHGGNILIDSQGNAMLTDFGTSTVMEERVARSMDEFMIKPVATEDGVQPKFISGRLSLDSDEQDQQQMGQGLSANKSLHHELSALTIRAATDVNMSSIRPDDVKSDDEKTYPLIGVMAYIAPERFRNPRFFDARCDIYSLGVLLWELTSGHSAFAKMAQDVQLAVAILNGKREQPIEGTPLTYQELYEQCWEPMPETRPSLDEILSTLEAVRTSMSEEQLATTRERSTAYDDTGAEFQESLSIPRPTSDYQKYLAFTQDRF
ncbi:hypothetical protein BGW38_005232 [Lunasporangiospora selenospora]|uniref:Protein kinase domain-containing protein n=1 Tax=Lunasporangiospora selenospora TaxID=979761 RepID=A0A9P6G0G6_9FUNG|nr:hypothetical protein BGW38_005232 [Lunasporangiospora selenospora]